MIGGFSFYEYIPLNFTVTFAADGSTAHVHSSRVSGASLDVPTAPMVGEAEESCRRTRSRIERQSRS